MATRHITSRLIVYAWALPNTMLGALLGVLILCLGGRVKIQSGVAEFSGRPVRYCVERLPRRCRFDAITLGHVILGVSESALGRHREHEQVHVRQYEKWGVFLLPAYLLSSAWQLVCGRSPYGDNFFERQAFAITSSKGPEEESL